MRTSVRMRFLRGSFTSSTLLATSLFLRFGSLTVIKMMGAAARPAGREEDGCCKVHFPLHCVCVCVCVKKKKKGGGGGGGGTDYIIKSKVS